MVSGRSGATLASKTFEKLLKLQNPQILDTDRDFESRSTLDLTVVQGVEHAGLGHGEQRGGRGERVCGPCFRSSLKSIMC